MPVSRSTRRATRPGGSCSHTGPPFRGRPRAKVEHVFVLGIDPGLSTCGYGAVRRDESSRLLAVAGGVVQTPPDLELPERLRMLLTELHAIVSELRPDVVVIEHVFFQKN